MPIVPLTVTIGLCLVFTFVVFFLLEHARGRVSSAERDSLLPLGEETPRLARVPVTRNAPGHGSIRDDGTRAPSPGSLQRLH